MRARGWLTSACILAAGAGGAVRSQSAAAEASAQFRIAVGITGTEPRRWVGKVAVTGAELTALEGWRFSQQDRAARDGAFDFRTKIGPLEDQLATDHAYGQTDWGAPRRRLIPQGLIVRIRGPESATVSFESSAGNFSFRPAGVPFGNTLAVLGGDGVVERLPVEQRISEAGPADDYPALAIAPDGARWIAWLAYQNGADEVVVSGGGQVYKLTGRGDHHAPAITTGGQGRIWAAWSQRDGETFQIYATAFEGGKWSKPEALTSGAGQNLWLRLASDGRGRLALVWQGFRRNQSVILGRLYDGRGWSPERQLSEGPGNAWTPAAAFGGGKLWVAWDSYATGAYQVYAREWSGPVHRVTRGENFSVRPSIAVTSAGPVVVWEESDTLWGKDFAFLSDRAGTPLYTHRRVRVAYLEGGQWRAVDALVAEAVPPGMRRFVQQPQLASDGERLYLAFRVRTSTNTSRIDYWASGGRWETFLTWLDGERWAPAIPMPSSVGRNGMRAALAVHKGQAHVAWPADNRAWPGVRYGEVDVYAAGVPVTAAEGRLKGGRPIEEPPLRAQSPHPNESEDTRRIREYRYKVNGKQYRILRGDLHRHTELSGDGAGDGSLDDLYRYELDAAAMDYGHVGDHQMGNDEEYNWWITQKSNDMYYMPQRFVPMYGYERSVWWPNGHRNIVWAERGKPVLRIGPEEAKGAANSGPILYPYLRETNGIATSHSSATEQGTDWRDNDPELEPFVELYQGFESSYEHAGAPRAWKEGEKPVHQGLRPLGYIWNAWAKGYKLGVQASSDHVSTHTSYACILAEDFTRQGLLDAMRKRHAYAATDLIVVDYRITTPEGTYLMGDILTTSAQPKLLVKVLSTAPIKRIDVIKNNTYIHKLEPGAREASFEYVDRAIQPGESYYYVRVEQANGELAWSSPIWVRHRATP